jgi:hypothetical protein
MISAGPTIPQHQPDTRPEQQRRAPQSDSKCERRACDDPATDRVRYTEGTTVVNLCAPCADAVLQYPCFAREGTLGARSAYDAMSLVAGRGTR